MKLKMRTTATLLIAIFFAMMIPMVMAKPGKGNSGFDQWGYNYEARLFNGLFGFVDENRPSGDGNPNTIFGAATDSYGYNDATGYHEVLMDVAGSYLRMKWSKIWHMAVFGPDGIRNSGDEQPWGKGAWCTNHVEGTGTVYAVDGTIIYQGHMTVLSKIMWVGDTTGYPNPIWGMAAVIQKVVGGQGQVFLQTPAGFGAVP